MWRTHILRQNLHFTTTFLYCHEIVESVWQEEENFEVLKRCYI